MSFNYNFGSLRQVLMSFTLPLTVIDNVCSENKLRPPHQKAVKCTVAPRHYPRTELWTTNMEMNMVTFALSAMNESGIRFHYRDYGYAIA